MRSDFDTEHQCGTHFRGQPDSQTVDYWMEMAEEMGDDPAEANTFDYEAAYLANDRASYRYWQETSGMDRESFRAAVERVFPTIPRKREIRVWATTRVVEVGDREAWLRAATQVARVEEHAAQEDAAQAAGYSCRLEAALDAEAAVEAGERRTGREATWGSPERATADRWYPSR